MKNLIILVLLLLLVSCTVNNVNGGKIDVYEGELRIKTFCEDRIVCYRNDLGVHSGVSCFRDDDLVNKYCT